MEDISINKNAASAEAPKKRVEEAIAVEPTFKVEPTQPTEEKKTDDTTEDPNKTPKNIHPYLGKKFDVRG